jgi:hypothetical protein
MITEPTEDTRKGREKDIGRPTRILGKAKLGAQYGVEFFVDM